ncbi:MAG: lytic transglycosylase domain-containing protein [Thiohalophilus sp.]
MRASALLLVAALLASPPLAADSDRVEPELRRLLQQAINDNDSFEDRFDAEVWLVDMSHRLKARVPDPQRRLSLLKQIHYEATRAGLWPELVLAVIEVESNFDRFAISSAGAMGLMQVMPFWLDEIGQPGDNLFDIRTNLRMGCTILKYYLDKENGNLTPALARYNGSYGSHRYTTKIYTALDSRWRRY